MPMANSLLAARFVALLLLMVLSLLTLLPTAVIELFHL